MDAFAPIRRIIVLIVGGLVLLVGVVMLFTPGPAVVVIPVGLAILASEFLWAKKLLQRFRREVERSGRRAGAWWQRWMRREDDS